MALSRIEVPTRRRAELVEITDLVRSAVVSSGVADGLAYVYCPHTTAGVTIQENADPDVQKDLLLALENAVPPEAPRGSYRHAEGNSDAHTKSSLVGVSQVILVEQGQLVLGTWQGIYFCEFDGPRTRHVLVKVVAG